MSFAATDISATLQELLLDVQTLLQQKWVELATEEARDSGRYIASIQRGDALLEDNGGEVTVFNDVPYAIWVEKGHGAFNLAEHIDPSKWKIGANGNRYIRIPFRQFTPKEAGAGASRTALRNEMSKRVYSYAKKLNYQSTGAGRTYLTKSKDLARTSTRAMYVPRLPSKLEGMFKGGSPGHTQYMTMRTITPNSKWIIPAQEGHFFTRRVAVWALPHVEEMVASRLGEDAKAMLYDALQESFG